MNYKTRQDVLTGKINISKTADVASGIILGGNRRGLFSVVEPVDETTNYVINCAFMAGKYPYNTIASMSKRGAVYGYDLHKCSASIANSDAPECYPMYGGWVKLTPSTGESVGISQLTKLPAGQYTLSCFIAGKPPHEYYLYVTDNAGKEIARSKTVRGNRNWQRIHTSFTATTSDQYRLHLMRAETDIGVLDSFYTSMWVCEDNPFLTLPFNGAYEEKYREDGEEYKWTGDVDWIGRSTRSSNALNSGRERFLKDYNFNLTQIIGLGASGIKHISNNLVSGGAVWNSTRVEQREFVLSGQIFAKTFEERLELESKLDDLLTSTSRRNIAQPTTLIFRVLNERDNSIIEGQTLYIYCRYNGGSAQTIPNEIGAYDISLSFTLIDPFIYSSMHKGFFLDDRVVMSKGGFHNVFVKDEGNDFKILNIASDGRIKRINRGEDGTVYVGGDFKSLNGALGTRFLARYNEDADTVSSIGAFSDNSVMGEGFVSDIIALANGNIIVAGAFDDINSVPNTYNVAMYNPADQSWSDLGGGAPDSDMVFNSIGIDQSENLYLGGRNVSGGDNHIYRYNIPSGNWSIIGSPEHSIDLPKAIISVNKILVVNRRIDPDFAIADLYITGRFAGVNTAPNTAGLAKFNGEMAEWQSLGDSILSIEETNLTTEPEGGVAQELLTEDADGNQEIIEYTNSGAVNDMVIGKDGRIYMVGNFTETVNGIYSPYIIRYNGKQFNKIGLPGSYTNYVKSARKIVSDVYGVIHILVDFFYDEITPLSKEYLVLSGNVWRSGGLYTSLSEKSIVSDGTLFWDAQKNRIWVASRTGDGKVTFGGNIRVAYNEGEQTYPTIRFFGGGELVAVNNKDTGKSIDFSGYTMQNGEVVKLDLEKYGFDIIKLESNINGNITKMIAPSSNIGFNMVRGKNRIGYILNNKSEDANCYIEWREKYLGIYNAMKFRNIL